MRIGIAHLTRAVVIGTVVTVSTFAQNPPVSTAGAAQASITARVEAIDQTTREVTLKGPLGNVVTFTVDKRVTRLEEVKVGDDVVADYYVSLAADFRAPTAEEKGRPITVLTEGAKAPAGTTPAAGVLRVTKAVVTVEGLDRPTSSLTVLGPKGNLVTVKVADTAALAKLRLGDTIIVTYTEALGVSIVKRAPVK